MNEFKNKLEESKEKLIKETNTIATKIGEYYKNMKYQELENIKVKSISIVLQSEFNIIILHFENNKNISFYGDIIKKTYEDFNKYIDKKLLGIEETFNHVAIVFEDTSLIAINIGGYKQP